MAGLIRTASVFIPLAIAACGLAAPAAHAQVLIPTDQVREIRGEGMWTDPGGNSMQTGPLSVEAPAGWFGSWLMSLNVPGFITGNAMQNGGFDDIDTITLEGFSLNLGGGGPPGSSAAASLEQEFTYSFNLPAPVTYTTTAIFAVAGPSSVPNTVVDFSGAYTLTGPGGEIFRHETGPGNGYSVAVVDATGSLAAGAYTLSLIIGGDVSFIAPADGNGNGAGGGGGGPTPLITFRVEAGGTCPADWNGDGEVNSSDISGFITSWLDSVQNGNLNADFNDDGQVNSSDISAFITAWLAAVSTGC